MEANQALKQSVPERQSEISAEMEKLTSQCAVLGKQVIELETRLVKVLALRSENASGGSTNSPEPVRVPLAQTIHERYQELCALSEQLNSIINRVEL